MASAVAVPAGVQFAAARTLGWDGEDGRPSIEDLDKLAPSYMRGHQLVPISAAGDPDVEYIDLSYMMPYDFFAGVQRDRCRQRKPSGSNTCRGLLGSRKTLRTFCERKPCR